MISLVLAAVLAVPLSAPAPQAVQARLQSCSMESGRWVCRYAVPDIEIVPLPGNDIVADAPAVVLGDGSTAAPAATETVEPPATTPPSTSGPATSGLAIPTPVEPERRVVTLDSGILTEREAQLVARCADAGWLSLCLPDDRRAARLLKQKEDTFLAVRADVTAKLAKSDCDGAVRAALDGGYLDLAGQARAFCAAAAPVADTAESVADEPKGAEPAATDAKPAEEDAVAALQMTVEED